ncbi:MAG: SpoIIE family protein phosphatase [Candidatus Cloacimonetes bacterium]|nr:SpoIIE family protein phosphatase [Candidatus Cloacimonadota bacterium]
MSNNNNQKYELKVLLCEDSRNTLHSLSNILQHRFKHVIIAEDGLAGLQKYKAEQPDLIITDIKMPRISGLEMIKKIRAENSLIKIIIISAHTDINYFIEAIDFHISAFINKPVDFRILDSHLKEISADIFLRQRTLEAEEKQIAVLKEQEKLFLEIKQDLALARTVQEYLLPEWLLFNYKLIFSTAYVPSLDVGGDLFGYYPINDDTFVFYLGDVSGHGLKAAMLMMAANSTINMLIDQSKPHLEPAVILTELNKILCKHLFISNNYMTIILGTVNLISNEVRYIRAGHPEIIVFDHLENKARLLDNDNGTIPVGWLPTHQYSSQDENILKLADHQTIFIYSDGLYECTRSDNSRLGQETLLKEMNYKIPQSNPLTASLEFMEYVKQAGYDISQDDFTLVSFFKPYSASMIGLKQYYQADIPEDMELDNIRCESFLLHFTNSGKFARLFESDINRLFSSESFQGERNIISGFILLLAYDNGFIECNFWLKSHNPNENQFSQDDQSERQPLTKDMITSQLNSLEIKSNGYLKEVKFKTLGEILQVICLLDPFPDKN